MNQQGIHQFVNQFGAVNAEVSVRMKQYKTEEEMNNFLAGISSQLTVNNLNVHGVTILAERRKEQLAAQDRQMKTEIIILVFIMVNVFFGIIGTFWVRTEQRRGEIGLRIAMGSTRSGIYRYMYQEGLLLLAFTLPVFILFAANVFYFDLYLNHQLPDSFLRYMSSIGGTYLIIAGMICLGISIPAFKAVHLQPAEALSYE